MGFHRPDGRVGVRNHVAILSAMDNTNLDEKLEKLYPAKDYHTLYFGEILACYQTD